MNPYLLINLGTSPLVYYYQEIILLTEWVETMPISEREPVLTVEISLDKWQADPISGQPVANGIVKLFLDDQILPIRYHIRATLNNQGGLLKYIKFPNPHSGWYLYNWLSESKLSWAWLRPKRDQIVKLVEDAINNWQPSIEDTPSGGRWLNWTLLYPSTEAGMKNKESQPATVDFDPYISYPDLDPSRKYKSGLVTIGYGLFNNKAIFAVEPAGVFLRSEIFHTPEEAVEVAQTVSAYGQKQEIAVAQYHQQIPIQPAENLIVLPPQSYINELVKDLKARVDLLRKGFDFYKAYLP